MDRICSWCSTSIGEVEPLDDKRVTHSICKACLQLEKIKFRRAMVAWEAVFSISMIPHGRKRGKKIRKKRNK